jgi:hypothetical protein
LFFSICLSTLLLTFFISSRALNRNAKLVLALAFPFFGRRPSESLLLLLLLSLLLLLLLSELSSRFFFPASLPRLLCFEPLPSDSLELLLRAFFTEPVALRSLARLPRAFLSELAVL